MRDAPARVEPAAAASDRGSRQQGVPLVLLGGLIVSLMGTAVSVSLLIVPAAIVAAFSAAVFWVLFAVARMRRRAAAARAGTPEAPAPAPAAGEGREPDELEIAPDVDREVVAAERAGLRTCLIIAVPLVILAVSGAAVIFGWKAIGLGALLLFAVMAFMGAPVWLAAVEDDIDEEEERIGVETRSIR